MKKIFLILSFLSIAFVMDMFILGDMYAADNGNGVDVTSFSNNHSFGNRAIWFSSFDATSTTYVYNEAGGQTATSGLMNTQNIVNQRNFFVSVPTLTSTSITVRIESQPIGSSEWFEVVTQVISAATTIGITLPIVEYSGNMRVGLLVIDDASGDVVNVWSEMISQKQ